MTALALVPSQVPGASHIRARRRKDDASSSSSSSSSSGVFHCRAGGCDDDSEAGDHVVYAAATPASSGGGSSPTSSSSSAGGGSHRDGGGGKKISIPKTGNMPDVHWRAISMSHLRSHPNFRPLPPPSMIRSLPTREHVRYFRQDSWQWDYLHAGRCTTSQCSSALGFLEPRAADFLGIPKSLQRGGGAGAWDRLRQVPGGDLSLEGLEGALCEQRGPSALDDERVWSWRPGSRESERLWKTAASMRVGAAARTKPFPFAAKYIPSLTRDDLCRRKLRVSEHHHASSPSPIRTRMQWGNAQEATSILTALNYFCGVDNRTVIREVGMCGAMFDDELDDPLLRGGENRRVLEVKNHCPFVWNRISPTRNGQRHHPNNDRRRKQRVERKQQHARETDGRRGDDGNRLPRHFLIRDFELERRIPPVYLPQLMMEMLCVGNSVNLDKPPESTSPICTSAIMVRQTATRGAILLRLRRDEGWINEMKYWLGQFQMEYVRTDKIPDDNFFWDDDPGSRYRRFLSRTKDLRQLFLGRRSRQPI
ncbi:hypothetical protein ACHAW5_006532 [Stephanodiscus triporus]|uniref:Uncharacterized protein n=1 Tax=Stephanodiscus triporus TaxID=2934178 RepID=A0ABD3PB93_9STRA